MVIYIHLLDWLLMPTLFRSLNNLRVVLFLVGYMLRCSLFFNVYLNFFVCFLS